MHFSSTLLLRCTLTKNKTMLRLLKDSNSAQLYPEHYRAFPKLSSKKGEKNDVITIRKDTENIQVLFVEGRNLVTYKSDNVLPFFEDPTPIISVHQYDRFYEDDIQLIKLAESLALWILSVIKSLPSLRLLLFDFSSNHETPNEMEMRVDPLDHFGRVELMNAPSRVYVKLFTLATSILERKADSLPKLKNPIKIVSHVGGTAFTPMVVSMGYEDTSIKFLKYNHYYVSVKEQRTNEWMQRYTFTSDSLGFFIDLLNQPENSKFNYVMVYTFDEHCLAPLLRLLLERSTQNLKTLLVYLPVEQPIFANVNLIKDIIATVVVNDYFISGTSVSLLAVYFLLESISDLFSDLETLFDMYSKLYNSSEHLYAIDWVDTQKVKRNNLTGITTLTQNLISRIESGELIKNKLGIILLLSDLSVIAETPMNIKDDMFQNKNRYTDLVCTARIWLVAQDFLLELLLNNKIDSNLHQRKTFVLFAHVICYLIPILHERVDTTIENIQDLVTFLRSSQEHHAQCIRALLSDPNSYKRVKKVEMLSEYNHILNFFNENNQITIDGNNNTELHQIDLNTIIKMERLVTDIDSRTDYLDLFIDFLVRYDNYWSEKIWKDMKDSTTQLANHFVIDYDENLGDIIRPLFFSMGKKRLEYMERYQLIKRQSNSFTLNINSDWVKGLSSIPQMKDTIESKLYYSLARKYPLAWRHTNKVMSETEYNVLVDSLEKNVIKWKYKNINSDLHYYTHINTMFLWEETFPDDISESVISLLTTRERNIDNDNKIWKILWSVVPKLMDANAVDNAQDVILLHTVINNSIRLGLSTDFSSLNVGDLPQKYGVLILPNRVNTDILNEAYWTMPSRMDKILFSIQTPSIKTITKTFYPLIQIILRNLLYCGIPSDQFPTTTNLQTYGSIKVLDKTYVVKGVVSPKLLDFILGYKFFATRENFSTDLLSRLFRTIALKESCWYSMGITESGVIRVVIVLCKVLMQLCADNTTKIADLRTELDSKGGIVDEVVRMIEEDIKTYEAVQIVELILHQPNERAILKTLVTSTGFDDLGKLSSVIVNYIFRCRLFSDSSATFRIEFIIHILEWLDELIRITSAQKDSQYSIAVDFSFDLFQPLMKPENTDKYLIYRLYELPYKSQILGGELDHYHHLDTDSEIVNLNKYKQHQKKKVGIPPSQYVNIIDPLDGKNYLCLAWDYTNFDTKVLPVNMQDTIIQMNKQNVIPDSLWSLSLLENAAAAWWLSSAEFRSKIKIRGDLWDSSKWNDWLLKAHSKGLLHLTAPIDPMVQCYERVKIFNIRVKESEKIIDNSSKRTVCYPGGELLSEQLGVEMFMNMDVFKKIDNALFENLNLKRYTADKRFINEYYRESVLKPKQVFDNRTHNPVRFGNSQAKHTTDQFEDKKFTSTEHNVCTRMDGYWDTTQEGSSHSMTNICYIHLPRLLHEMCDPPVPNQSDNQSTMEDAQDDNPFESILKINNVRERVINTKYLSKEYTYFYECNVSTKDVLNFKKLPRLKRKLVEEIMKYFPLRHGFIYKFYVYSKYKRSFRIILENKTERNVDYEVFIKDNRFKDDTNSWHYEISTSPDRTKHVKTKFILQGVYGNRLAIKSLYSLFYYSLTKMDGSPDFSNKLEFDSVPYNDYSRIFRYITVSPIMDIYQTSNNKRQFARKYIEKQKTIINGSRTGGDKLLPFVFKLKTEYNIRKFNEIFNEKKVITFEDSMYSSSLYYGYNNDRMWKSAVFKWIYLWLVNSYAIPDYSYVSRLDGSISVINSFMKEQLPNEMSLIRIPTPFLSVCSDGDIFNTDLLQKIIKEKSPNLDRDKLKLAIGVAVVKDAISDCCSFFEQMVEAARNYKTFEQKKISDCMFLVKSTIVYPIIENIMLSKMCTPMIFVDMNIETLCNILVHFISTSVIKYIDLDSAIIIQLRNYVTKILSKRKTLTIPLYTFIEELVDYQTQELDSPTFFIENEVIVPDFISFLYEKNREQRHVYLLDDNDNNDSAETGPFEIVDMDSAVSNYLKGAQIMAKDTFQDYLTLETLQETLDLYASLVQKSDRPNIMRLTIGKLRKGNYSFYTTNNPNLEREITGGDDMGDTESILETLSEDQKEFFEDPDEADRRLEKLDVEKRETELRGLKEKKGNIKERKEIYESIRIGRQILFMFANSGIGGNIDQLSGDTELINILYSYECDLHSNEETDSIAKLRTKLGNKWQTEIKLRQWFTLYLKSYGLLPVFSGEYNDSNSSTIEQKKENNVKFDTGVTFNYPAAKYRKLIYLTGPTFIQSFLIAASYLDKQDTIQRKFYMRYLNYMGISGNYAHEPTLTKEDDQQVPILNLININEGVRIFSDRFTNVIDMVSQYYKDCIAPNVNVDLEIRNCKLYARNFKTLKRNLFQNPNKNEHTKTIHLIHITKKFKGGKVVNYFEPLFRLASIQQQDISETVDENEESEEEESEEEESEDE